MRYLLFAIAITAVFTIFTTVFAISANPNQVRLLPKWVWVVICLLVPILGGILYITLGRPMPGSYGTSTTRGPNRGPGSTTRTSTIAPDDDPDFLKRLRDRLNRDDDSTGADPDEDPTDDTSADGGKPNS
jgi:hypothetical protein